MVFSEVWLDQLDRHPALQRQGGEKGEAESKRVVCEVEGEVLVVVGRSVRSFNLREWKRIVRKGTHSEATFKVSSKLTRGARQSNARCSTTTLASMRRVSPQTTRGLSSASIQSKHFESWCSPRGQRHGQYRTDRLPPTPDPWLSNGTLSHPLTLT